MDVTPAREPKISESAGADRVSRVIFEYAAQIWREQDKDAQIALIASLARELVGADRCSIWLKDPVAKQLYTRVSDGLREIRIPAGQGIVGNCIETGQISVVNNTESDSHFANTVDRNSGYRTESILTVPLRNGQGEVVGACQVLNKPGGFVESDIDLVSLAAGFSAEAIDNQQLQRSRELATRLQCELDIARDVQQSLLPQEPLALQALECEGFCRPVLQVGGDFYNYWSLSDDTVVVAMGDVAGKGIAAALLMASIQASLESLITHRSDALPALMKELNQIILDITPPTRYTTLFLAKYDPKQSRMTYVNAGQAPPVIYRQNAEPLRLSEGGPPVGLLEGVTFTQDTVPFQSSDWLVCFSDGISESMNGDFDEWGEDAMIDELATATKLPVRGLIDHLVRAADIYANGAPQHDDMTVLALHAR